MTKPIRMRLHSLSGAIDLLDYDAGNLEPIEKGMLDLGAERLLSVGNPLEEVRRYRLGGSEVMLGWDGYVSTLRTIAPSQLAVLFEALSQSPLFEDVEKDESK